MEDTLTVEEAKLLDAISMTPCPALPNGDLVGECKVLADRGLLKGKPNVFMENGKVNVRVAYSLNAAGRRALKAHQKRLTVETP